MKKRKIGKNSNKKLKRKLFGTKKENKKYF